MQPLLHNMMSLKKKKKTGGVSPLLGVGQSASPGRNPKTLGPKFWLCPLAAYFTARKETPDVSFPTLLFVCKVGFSDT